MITLFLSNPECSPKKSSVCIHTLFIFSVPPNSVTLKEPKTTKAGEYLELACTATDSNPKSTMVWYRGPANNQVPILDAGKTLLLFCFYWYCVFAGQLDGK